MKALVLGGDGYRGWPTYLYLSELGEMRVCNQFTEEFSELVVQASSKLGVETRMKEIENPRVEKYDHYYKAAHTKLLDLGLEPHHRVNRAPVRPSAF